MSRARAPRRVRALVDARSIASSDATTDASGEAWRRRDGWMCGRAATFRALVARAVARASDGAGRSREVVFDARTCDGWVAPHAHEARTREADGRGRDAGACGFSARDGRELDRSLRALEESCERYVERFPMEDASGSTREWLVNLTRYAGAAANDFSSAGFGSAFGADEDEDEDGGGNDRGVLFIVTRLPKVSSEEAGAIDPGAVVKSFRGVEEQLKRERVQAHLLYVGDAPSGVFATVLRDVFQRLNGAVLSLDAACRLASWAPLYATLDALSRGTSSTTSEAVANESTTSVDILVETKSSLKPLRLGEAHVTGPSGSRCVSFSIVGFVDRTLVPATTLASESQTVFFFDDSPLRALMAMLVLKDSVAVVRGDTREHRRVSVLEPFTSSSFVVTSLKLDALECDGEETLRSHSEATSVAIEVGNLVTKTENLMSLESVHGLLAKIREDMCEKLVSPTSTQPSTTQDSLALTQQVIGSFRDVSTQPTQDDQNARTVPLDVRTVADAMAADCELSVSQSATRLESWYGSRDLAPTTRQMLRHSVHTDESIVSKEKLQMLDARFKTMMKNHLGIVSPPRKCKARRSLALSSLPSSDGFKPWMGDVDAAAREEYNAFVATLGNESIDPDTREFAVRLILRFRESLDGDNAESFDRIEKTLAKSAKELQDKYKEFGSSKSAKRLEFVLQMHVALQIATLKVMSARHSETSETREAVEERVLPKKEQRAIVKRVKKLMHDIEFLLDPIGIAGIRAVVEKEFLPNYEDALPDTLRSLQVALGISTEPMAEDRNATSVAMTPFSPQALPPPRRSPRKHKQPEVKADDRATKQQPSRVSWHPIFRSHKTREVQMPAPRPPHGFAKPPAVLNRGGGGTSRNAIAYTPARPTVVSATPLPAVSGTPAARSRPGVVMETPIGAHPVGVLTPRLLDVPPTPKHLFATPAAKKTRFSE